MDADRLFYRGQLVARDGSHLRAIIAWSQLAVALEAILEGVLSGAGATRAIFWASTPINLMRIPFGWYFAIKLGYGPIGLWWVLNITTYAKVIIKGWIVQRGSWSTGTERPHLVKARIQQSAAIFRA